MDHPSVSSCTLFLKEQQIKVWNSGPKRTHLTTTDKLRWFYSKNGDWKNKNPTMLTQIPFKRTEKKETLKSKNIYNKDDIFRLN